jgi:hypothetical protein
MSDTTPRRSALRRELRQEIVIDATPDAVWRTLTATADYSWNPFIHRVDGPLAVGAKLEVEIEPPASRPMKFKPTVLEIAEQHRLRWLGRFLMPGLLDGEHTFELEPLSGGRTRFVQTERFSGILVGIFRSTLDKTERGFTDMNQALKVRAEATDSIASVRMAAGRNLGDEQRSGDRGAERRDRA